MHLRHFLLTLLPLTACASADPAPGERSASTTSALTGAPYVTVSTVHALTRTEGGHSRARLLEAADGRFYGVGYAGGANAGGDPQHSCSSDYYTGTDVFTNQCPGSLFAVSRAGVFEVIHAFTQLDPTTKRNADGYQPVTGLAQGADGWLYGVAPLGGEGGLTPTTQGCGTAYRIDPSSHAFETLWNFCSDAKWAAGAFPRGVLQADGAGGWLGAAGGGVNSSGVVFRLVDHTATQLVHFDPKGDANVSGSLPYASPIFGTDGLLYGATSYGGANNQGALYKIDPSAKTLTGMVSFGPGPFTGDDKSDFGYELVADSDGWMYGVSHLGGVNDAGFVYRVSPSGALQVLHAFDPISVTTSPRFANADGARPLGALAFDRYHNLYGTTSTGGANGTGTLYQMTRDGSELVKLYDFPAPSAGQGYAPLAGVVVSHYDGSLWGTTFAGGSGAYGTIFRASGPLSFEPVTGAEPGALVESAPIRVTILARPTISISNGEYSINGGAWSSAPDGAIHTGDTLVVRGVAPSTPGERVLVAVGFGHQVSSGFQITTRK